MEIIYYSDANFVKTPSQASETRLRADGLLKVTHTHTMRMQRLSTDYVLCMMFLSEKLKA